MKIIIPAIILTLLGGCSMTSQNYNQIKAAIYPSSGGLSKTYYFVFNKSGELLVEYGTRTGDDLNKNPFIIKNGNYEYASEKVKLKNSDTIKIIELANKIYQSDIKATNDIIFDGWNIQIIYGDKTIEQNYWDDSYPEFRELIDTFIKLSPIELDLDGLA